MPCRLADDISTRVRPWTTGDDLEELPLLPVRLGIVDIFERPEDQWHRVVVGTIKFADQFVLPTPVHWGGTDYGLYANPIK